MFKILFGAFLFVNSLLYGFSHPTDNLVGLPNYNPNKGTFHMTSTIKAISSKFKAMNEDPPIDQSSSSSSTGVPESSSSSSSTGDVEPESSTGDVEPEPEDSSSSGENEPDLSFSFKSHDISLYPIAYSMIGAVVMAL